MLTPDTVELLIAGKAHGDWSGYEIDSDLLTPADAWHVTLGMTDGRMPPVVAAGAPVVVKIGGETVMTGRVDEISHQVGKASHTFTMSGRDQAAVLVDCSAPVFVARMASLNEIVAKIVRPLGITKIHPDAENIRTREKINIEPGDSAWDALAHAAEANGLWPWFEPDGTLVIGGPDYSAPVVATLVLRKSGKGNNVIGLAKQESVHGRYSEVTVLGQTHGTEQEQGKHALRGSWKDDGVSWYRPKVVTDHEADSHAVCVDRAHKLISDSRLNGMSLSAMVYGHRIAAPGQPSDGLLWKPGQRIRVISEPHNLDAIYFLMARKFTRSRMDGTRTALTLKEDGMWVLDAHPHKNKHRRGKNNLPGKIIDVSGGAQ
ncbi:MAG: phage tail protein [Nitrosomonadales bacterium]|nr:phage tail protein [Nitrosomonadales bacterium]